MDTNRKHHKINLQYGFLVIIAIVGVTKNGPGSIYSSTSGLHTTSHLPHDICR